MKIIKIYLRKKLKLKTQKFQIILIYLEFFEKNIFKIEKKLQRFINNVYIILENDDFFQLDHQLNINQKIKNFM